jgi:hypothetical protein
VTVSVIGGAAMLMTVSVVGGAAMLMIMFVETFKTDIIFLW